MKNVFRRPHTVLPGFHITLAYTLFYLVLVVLIPLSTLGVRSASPGDLWPNADRGENWLLQ